MEEQQEYVVKTIVYGLARLDWWLIADWVLVAALVVGAIAFVIWGIANWADEAANARLQRQLRRERERLAQLRVEPTKAEPGSVVRSEDRAARRP